MIKLDVISGFLGSGKTSFIKKLIEHDAFPNEKVVILENEYGEVNMDSKYLSECSIPVYEITKGCICCSLKGDFIETLDEIGRTLNPDRVIVEPSGIFMLETLKDLLQHPSLSDYYRLGTILTIVDATFFSGKFIPMEMMIGNQIKHADTILISKSEGLPHKNTDTSHAFIRRHNTSAAIIQWDKEDTSFNYRRVMDPPPNCVHGECAHQPVSKAPHRHHGHGHHHTSKHDTLQSETFKTSKKFLLSSFEKFVQHVKKGGYGDIIRMKGLVNIDDEPYAFHYVNGVSNLEKTTHLSPDTLIVIGRHLERNALVSYLT